MTQKPAVSKSLRARTIKLDEAEDKLGFADGEEIASVFIDRERNSFKVIYYIIDKGINKE